MIKNINGSDVQNFQKLFSGNGCRQVWCRYPNELFKEVFFCKSDKLSEKLNGFEVNSDFDYYITKNAFYADKRGNNCLCYLDNIVIDIDNHRGISENELEHEVSRLLFFLAFDYEDKFPCWKFSVRSGRGVQLWIHLESIAPALTFLYDIVVKSLCDTLIEIINENGINLSVDVASSCNPSGLVRLPFSFNTHSNTYIGESKIEFYEYSTYSIDDLISEFDIKKPCKAVSSERPADKIDEDYAALHKKRMKFIENYLKNYDYDIEGHRNAAVFLYYNAAVQVMEHSKALELTNNLRKMFKKQYSESEFRAVINAVDKKVYRLNTETFFDILGLSEDERKVYQNMSYKKKIDRVERNKQIMQLAVQRKTCQEIAESVGCSVRTVKTVLKNFDKKEFLAVQVKELRKTMTVKQVSEALNISESTVHRLQRVSKTAKIL